MASQDAVRRTRGETRCARSSCRWPSRQRVAPARIRAVAVEMASQLVKVPTGEIRSHLRYL
jgi:hypothetical protein